jgi:hypothetical protein
MAPSSSTTCCLLCCFSDRSFLGMLLAGHDYTTESALDDGQILAQVGKA